MRIRPSPSPILDSWQKVLDATNENPRMPSLRGRLSASWLLLAPPPTAVEYQLGLPFCDASAHQFHRIMLSETVNTEDDFLVIPISCAGAKPSKRTTAEVLSFITRRASLAQTKGLVCLGGVAYKYALGEGTAGPMTTLVGQTIFPKQFGYKPVLVLPDPRLLTPPEQTGLTDRDLYYYKRNYPQHVDTFSRLAATVYKLVHRSA